MTCSGGWPRQTYWRTKNVKNIKKATAVTVIAGGLLAVGAGVSSAHGGASADGQAVGSPGVVSGNQVQVPVHVPVNVVGNTVTVIGLLNGVWGNTGVNA
ncbi:chaplin [Streptomyces sp. WM6372]|nr:chaplin [Streptomyces sp. WM6372]